MKEKIANFFYTVLTVTVFIIMGFLAISSIIGIIATVIIMIFK